ncbi:MAG TPA: DoxX family protein [Gemmataceae bacterium]|nr:DoxX family protein [Gemmataceae bacterium]
MTDPASAAPSRSRVIAYWVTTGLVAAEAVAGGVSDVLRLPYVVETLERLGYPGDFAVILGVWKLPGAAAILAPGVPRLKEWAYAGMFFNMTGAVASHLAVSDGAETVVGPLIFTGLILASWALRPPDRRDLASSAAPSRSRAVAYWVTTGLLALECGVGGVMATLRLPPFSGNMEHLGYPAYLMTILGVWYFLAGVALLVPRLPRLKEWAYAGLVFTYTGAVASHLAVGDGAGTLVAPVLFTGLVAASWVLRPSSRGR